MINDHLDFEFSLPENTYVIWKQDLGGVLGILKKCWAEIYSFQLFALVLYTKYICGKF